MTRPMTSTQAHPGAPRRTGAPTRRAALGMAGAGALAALLTSCGPGGERMPAGVATVVADQRLVDPAWAAMPFRSSHAIELPGVRYLVRELGTTPTLTRTEAVGLFVETPEETGEDGLVHAAEGEVFLLAHLVSMPPLLLPLAPRSDDLRTERFLVGDTELEPGGDYGPMNGIAGDSRFIVASVPEGAGAEHVRLEVTAAGGTQVLSLLDGSRLASPIDHLYAQSFTAEPAPRWWERRDEAVAEGRPVLAGTVYGVRVPVVHSDDTLPEPGNVVLGVQLSRVETPSGVDETSTVSLLLPNGDEVPSHSDPSATSVEPGEDDEDGSPFTWFEVPHTTESVTVRMHLSASTEAGELDLGPEEIPVTIARRPR